MMRIGVGKSSKCWKKALQMGEVLYSIVVYSEIYGVISYCMSAIFENRMIHTQRNQYLGCKTLKGFGGFKVFGQQKIKNIGYQKEMLLHTGMGKSQHGWFQIQFIWFEGRLDAGKPSFFSIRRVKNM